MPSIPEHSDRVIARHLARIQRVTLSLGLALVLIGSTLQLWHRGHIGRAAVKVPIMNSIMRVPTGARARIGSRLLASFPMGAGGPASARIPLRAIGFGRTSTSDDSGRSHPS